MPVSLQNGDPPVAKSAVTNKSATAKPIVKPTIDPTDWANKRQMAMDKARETRERRREQAKKLQEGKVQQLKYGGVAKGHSDPGHGPVSGRGLGAVVDEEPLARALDLRGTRVSAASRPISLKVA